MEVNMDSNTMIVLVALLFVVLIIIGFILFRRKTKVGIELPGSKLNFEGSNETAGKKPTTSKGILRNWSFGKTRMEINGPSTISDNVRAGDTELKVEETVSQSKDSNKVRQRRKQ
jgi:hypothetical protein